MTIRSKATKLAVIGVFTTLVAVIIMASSRPAVLASASGPSPSYTNAPAEGNCTACHIGSDLNSGGGSVTISGLPASYVPGQQISIMVTTSQEDAVVYGFQLTAIDQSGKTVGTFSLPNQSPAKMQVIQNMVGGNVRRYVEHTLDGLVNTAFGSNSWTFTWMAPPESAGSISFYAAGNSANGDGSPAGDFIYSTSQTVAAADTSIEISGRVLTSGGQGLRNALVRLSGPAGMFTVPTSSLGYYSITNVPAGLTYTISVASRRYRFESRELTPSTNLADVDFTGLE
jgi:hypothetical protein